MNLLYFYLIIAFFFSLLLCYLSVIPKKSALELVDDMGLGWNLGNTFDSYNNEKEIKDPNEQITLWGNIVPTRELFVNLKKFGFKTIRFPVTWMHFMDKSGKVSSDWMLRVKEVIDWIINLNMYCILNLHHDGTPTNWLSKGLESKDKFVYLWKQIAEEFKDYDEHLIFECMNDILFSEGKYDFNTLLIFNQAFIDTVRNTGSNNVKRLLVISGANRDLDLTCSKDYKLPTDISNKMAISIHYYLPTQFTLEKDDEPWTYYDSNGELKIVTPMTKWGGDYNFKEMFTNFETLKKSFLDKSIPIIITEIGVLTVAKKEIESIRDYLFAEYSMSGSYRGIMSCLWDNSNPKVGDMNYYDRINNKFYDEKIGKNFKKISRGKFIKPTDYYIKLNKETVTAPNIEGNMEIKIGRKTVTKVIFNVNIYNYKLSNVAFGIASNDKGGDTFIDYISGSRGKKEYDGSYTYTFDGSKIDYNNYVQIQIWLGKEFITFNYFTLEFDKSYTILDYKSYMDDLSF